MTVEEGVTDLIRSLGIDKLDEATRQKILPELFDTLQTRVGTRLAGTLSEEQMKKIDDLSKAGDEEAASAELKKYVPNYDDLVMEEVQELKEEMQSLLP